MAEHSTLVSIHPGAYVQSTDPGTVGANMLWIDTSAGPPYAFKVRNAGNTAWSVAATAAGPAGGDLSGTFPNPAVAGLAAGRMDVTEIAAPATPASGQLRLYAKTDHTLHIKDSTGADTALGAGGGGGAGLGANTFTGVQTTTVSDAATNTVVNPDVLGHNTSATPVAGFGTGMDLQAQDSTTASQAAARVATEWIDPAHATATSDLWVWLRNAGGALAKQLRILGGGGFQAQSTNAGGTQPNALGTRGVDWQTDRSAATQTASATDAVIGGGQQNTASAVYTTVAGGQANSATGNNAFVGGGYNNLAGTQTCTTVAGGDSCQATGNRATVGGGVGNVAGADYSTIAGGKNASTSYFGQHAQAAGVFTASGDAQISWLVARNTSTSATPVQLYLDGASLLLTLATARAFAYKLTVIARDGTTPGFGMWTSQGLLHREAGNVALVGNTDTVVTNTPGYVFACSADTTNQALSMTFTGLAGKTVHVVARIELTEVV